MYKKGALRISIFANIAFLAFGAHAVYRRGGIAYLRSHWDGTPIVSSDRLVRQSLFEFLARPSAGPSVVFLGDSITEFCEWDELLGIPVINRGISGDTTADVLSRLDAVSIIQPTSVFLMVGINDAADRVRVAAAAHNYREIIQHIRVSSPKTIIYVQSVLPVYSPMADQLLGHGRGAEINQWVRAMNEQIRDLADNKSVIFLDLRDDLSPRGELDSRYSADGVHLNGAGYGVWKNKVSPFLITANRSASVFRSY
jgi:lysophospholipase L1-like esterase